MTNLVDNQDLLSFIAEGEDKFPEELKLFLRRVKFAFNERLKSPNCTFNEDFAKEEITNFVSLVNKQCETLHHYKSQALTYLNSLGLSPAEFNDRFKRECRSIDNKIDEMLLWYFRYLNRTFGVKVQYTVGINPRW